LVTFTPRDRNLTEPLIILASLPILVTVGSAFGKLSKVPRIMASMQAAGVSPDVLPILAGLEIAGAAGIVVGIWIPLLGQAGLVLVLH
jgi:hypothetical protein